MWYLDERSVRAKVEAFFTPPATFGRTDGRNWVSVRPEVTKNGRGGTRTHDLTDVNRAL